MVKFGVIGCGVIGTQHITNIDSINNSQTTYNTENNINCKCKMEDNKIKLNILSMTV